MAVRASRRRTPLPTFPRGPTNVPACEAPGPLGTKDERPRPAPWTEALEPSEEEDDGSDGAEEPEAELRESQGESQSSSFGSSEASDHLKEAAELDWGAGGSALHAPLEEAPPELRDVDVRQRPPRLMGDVPDDS